MNATSASAVGSRGRAGAAVFGARLCMTRNRLRQAGRVRRTRTIVRGSLIGFAGLWLMASVAAATYVAMETAPGRAAAADILTALFALVVIGGFIGTAGSSLQTFYMSSDLSFLLTLPIPLRVTFATKFVDAMIGSAPVAAIFLSALGGYWAARGERVWALGAAVFVGLLLLAATTAVAVLVVTAIGRMLPPKRAGYVLGAVSLLFVVLIWAAYSAVSPDLTANSSAGGDGSSALGLALADAGGRIAWTPVGWAATAVTGGIEGDLRDLVGAGTLVLGTAMAATLAAFAAFAATFARALGGYRMTSLALRQANRPLARWVDIALAPLPRPLAALVLKEWLTMFRDLRRLSGAIWPLGMVAIYTVLLSREDGAAPAGAPGLAFWLSCGTLALVPWGASLGISIYAFGTERRQIHLLRTLPITPRLLLVAKVLACLAPVLVLGIAAAVIVGSAQGATPGQFLGLLGLIAWASTGYVLIDISAAAIAPNFAAEQVQRATALAGRVVGFAAGVVFTLASGVAAARLVLFSTGVPDALRSATAWTIVGVAPLGWPLVLATAAVAVLDVAFVLTLARGSVAAIIRDGD